MLFEFPFQPLTYVPDTSQQNIYAFQSLRSFVSYLAFSKFQVLFLYRMSKRWIVKAAAGEENIDSLSKELNIHPILSNILLQRGVSTYEEAKKFFRPQLSELHNPFLMKDMEKAIDRIVKAMMNGEKILVYGDYDVDGTTSVALVYSYLRTKKAMVNFYLPDRYKEGYGISTAGIDWALKHQYSLIIALDCGIKSNDKIDYAKKLGIDFIICDHHLPGEKIPDACAVLDPKRSDCTYPYKELTGCGIGFKLVQAFNELHGLPFSDIEPYLDLVVASIGSDIVPITEENRILAYYGLEKLNTNPRKGFKAILELANVKKKLTVSDVVFTIGPRINAAGRIEDARRSVELLISEDTEDANTAGQVLNQMNLERRELDASITESALQQIRDDSSFNARKSTVVFNPEWHKGVLGIVASRLTEHYYRPTIVLTQSGDSVTGSARSVKDFDIHSALEKCSDLLVQFGGHRFAAGLTLKVENVENFSKRFDEVVAAAIEEKMTVQEIEIDAEIDLVDLTPSFFNVLKQFAPFGPGNQSPLFVTKNVLSKGMPRVVGSNHLKLSVFQNQFNAFDSIAFQQAERLEMVSENRTFSICYHLEENEWNGNVTLQLNIKDIREEN